MNNRLEWVDHARGIAFLMVIYSHLQYRNDIVRVYFSPIFLTTFFFISGYLFNIKYSFIEIFEQRFRTLLIPFFFYGVINLLLSQILTFSKHPSMLAGLADFLIQVRGRNDGLWFIACLFICTFPFYFIVKHIKLTKLFLGSVGCLFVLNNMAGLPSLPWHLQLICPAIFYMSLGYSYRLYEDKFEFINSRKMIFFTLLFYIIFTSLLYKITGRSVSFTSTKWVLDGWIITITGILLCILIAKNDCKVGQLLAFVGSNSLLYFALHGNVYPALQFLTEKVLLFASIKHNPVLDLSIGFVMMLLVAIILIIPIKLINKYLPWTTGKGFSFFGG